MAVDCGVWDWEFEWATSSSFGGSTFLNIHGQVLVCED